jgi:peroxiredoxin
VVQAPVVNRLYNLVVKSEFKDQVKFIAVGESDNGSSLQRFKAAHQVPFPMMPDPNWDIGVDVFHITGTPTTVLVDKSGKVLLVEVGVFDHAGAMFKRIKAKLQ